MHQDIFFLPFAPKEAIKANYAPSIGVKEFDEKNVNKIKIQLAKFRYLSCREQSGSKILERISGKDVSTVLDPTLLVSKQEWEVYNKEPSDKGSYILQYFLGDIINCRKFVKRLSEYTGFPVIVLPHSYLDIKYNNGKLKYIGPDEFIGLVKNAKYICTDSFHGTAFAINYNIQFFCFKKLNDNEFDNDNSRIVDIVSTFGLQDRLISDYKFPEIIKPIEYESVNRILSELRETSERYLKKVLLQND
jgi:hypothetical protein